MSYRPMVGSFQTTFVFCLLVMANIGTVLLAETMRSDTGVAGEVVIDDSTCQGVRFDDYDWEDEIQFSNVGLVAYAVADGCKSINVYFSKDEKIYLHPSEASVGFGNAKTRYGVRARAGKESFVILSFHRGAKYGSFDVGEGLCEPLHVRLEKGGLEIGRLDGWPAPAIDFEGKGKIECGTIILWIDGLSVKIEDERGPFPAQSTSYLLRPKKNGKYASYQYLVTSGGDVIKQPNPNR